MGGFTSDDLKILRRAQSSHWLLALKRLPSQLPDGVFGCCSTGRLVKEPLANHDASLSWDRNCSPCTRIGVSSDSKSRVGFAFCVLTGVLMLITNPFLFLLSLYWLRFVDDTGNMVTQAGEAL